MHRFVSALLRYLTIEKLIAVFLLLTVPMLFAPFFTDDFFHLLMLSDKPPIPHPDDGSLWGLFSFIDNSPEARQYLMQQGVLPWWTGENFYFKFWRPVAEITHRVDYTLAPGVAAFAHAHSSLWFIALCLVVYKIYGRLAVNGHLAFLALIIFMLDSSHAPTIEWVANRNALIGACFAALSFYCHILSRDRNAPGFYLFAVLWLVLALLSGESAIAIGGFLFAYAVCLDKQGPLKGFITLLPYAVVVVLWYLQYKTLGYGANGSAIHYVDAASMPVEFIKAALERVPVYVFSAFGFLPAEIYPALQLVLTKPQQLLVLFFIVSSIGILALILFPLIKKDSLIQFALLGAILASIPFCSIINQDRLTLIPSIGFDLVIAMVIYRLLIKRAVLWNNTVSNKLVSVTAIMLCMFHLVLSPLFLFAASGFIHMNAKKSQSKILQLENNAVNDTHVVIFQGQVTQSALLKPVRMINGLNYPESISLLSNVKGELEIKRISENGLSIKRDIGFVEGFEQSFRDLAKLPFIEGDTVNLKNMDIVVREVNASGQPLRIECYFKYSLDSSRYAFFTTVKKKGLVQVSMPLIGQSVIF